MCVWRSALRSIKDSSQGDNAEHHSLVLFELGVSLSGVKPLDLTFGGCTWQW
jgi:hypothetical protein